MPDNILSPSGSQDDVIGLILESALPKSIKVGSLLLIAHQILKRGCACHSSVSQENKISNPCQQHPRMKAPQSRLQKY
jgi:hypothetical protein